MEGIYLNRRDAEGMIAGSLSAEAGLLARRGEVEIMSQSLQQDDVVWITPAEDPLTMEFFFIHEGTVELVLDEETVHLGPGESFYAAGLSRDVRLLTKEKTELLYVATHPMFDTLVSFQDKLKQLLLQINEKDHYTYRHSGNVMRYCLKLFEALQTDCGGVTLDDIAIASLFHDVGKCFVPDEVLKKTDTLTMSEARYIIRHPIDSGRLLKPRFGEHVAEIAGSHHERVDGSGYPKGLTGEELSMPAKILAVADVFDAMTTARGYNEVKTFQDAADELYALSEQFDRKVTTALVELVTTNALQAEDGDGNDKT